MNLDKELKNIKTKKEKAIFLRKLILNSKIGKKTKEKVIKELNNIFEEENLEDRITTKSPKIIENGQKENIGVISRNVLHSQKNVVPNQEEKIISYSTEKQNEPKMVYSSHGENMVNNLKSFINRKGLLEGSSFDRGEIGNEIYKYFDGNLSPTNLDSYVNLFTKDSIEYAAFKDNTMGFNKKKSIDVGGKKKEFYTLNSKEEIR